MKMSLPCNMKDDFLSSVKSDHLIWTSQLLSLKLSVSLKNMGQEKKVKEREQKKFRMATRGKQVNNKNK